MNKLIEIDPSNPNAANMLRKALLQQERVINAFVEQYPIYMEYEQELSKLGFTMNERMSLIERFQTDEKINEFLADWRTEYPPPYKSPAQRVAEKDLDNKQYQVRNECGVRYYYSDGKCKEPKGYECVYFLTINS